MSVFEFGKLVGAQDARGRQLAAEDVGQAASELATVLQRFEHNGVSVRLCATGRIALVVDEDALNGLLTTTFGLLCHEHSFLCVVGLRECLPICAVYTKRPGLSTPAFLSFHFITDGVPSSVCFGIWAASDEFIKDLDYSAGR